MYLLYIRQKALNMEIILPYTGQAIDNLKKARTDELLKSKLYILLQWPKNKRTVILIMIRRKKLAKGM